FVALATAATATSRIKVGSGICLLVERDPITTAKEEASIDHLSGGRMLFGIGAGWNAEEMEHHGTVFRTRWKLLKERVQAMKAIWTQDEASFDGELVQFEPIWSWPKPIQRPHPPVILGAHGPKALARVVDYCDGWIPIGVRSGDLGTEIASLHRLARGKGGDPARISATPRGAARALAREKGRDPASISVTVYGAPGDREVLAPLRDAGVTRAVFSLPPAGPEKVLPLLDRYAGVARALAA